VVEATPFPYSHHAIHIKRVLNEQINRIPFRHTNMRVVAVTDSAASMLKATNDCALVDENIRCIAHIINNSCEDAFADSLKLLITKCKQLAAAAHKSPKTCQILKDTLSWLQTFGDKDSEAVKKLIKSIPMAAQFEMLEALLPHLRKIQTMSERLTSDKSPTLHLVIMVLVIFQNLKSKNAGAKSFLNKFKASLADKVPNCGREVALWAIGAFLHPQNKGTIFCFRLGPRSPVTKELLEDVKLEIVNRVTALGWDEQEEEEDPEVKEEEGNAALDCALAESQCEEVSDYLKSVNMMDVQPEGAGPEPQNDIAAQIELNVHKLQQPKESDCDILAFWKANKASVPTLAKFARSILCIPASSASSERLFSAAGKIISSSRTKISSSRAEQLIYINQNYNLALPYIKSWDIGSVKNAPETPSKAPATGAPSAGAAAADPQQGTYRVEESDNDPKDKNVFDDEIFRLSPAPFGSRKEILQPSCKRTAPDDWDQAHHNSSVSSTGQRSSGKTKPNNPQLLPWNDPRRQHQLGKSASGV
jgi:KRAB domain-containing zinc finger protein